jgi:hypothetical protein
MGLAMIGGELRFVGSDQGKAEEAEVSQLQGREGPFQQYITPVSYPSENHQLLRSTHSSPKLNASPQKSTNPL